MTEMKQLDAQGLLCPEPIMMLHQAIRQIEVGQKLELLATDPATKRDVLKFCTFLGHALETQEAIKLGDLEQFRYVIRKNEV